MSDFEIVDQFIQIDVEDDLTKAVFGCLQLLGPTALNEIFADDLFDFSFETAPKYTFHETVDKREPDVVIEDGENLTIMVEAKVDAPTDAKQLSDEYADLSSRWSSETLRLLHVTEDRLRPAEIDSVQGIPADVLVWTNWRNLASAVLNVDTAGLSAADDRVVKMLVQVFEDQGFTPFGGFKLMNDADSLSDQLNQAYRVREQYYDDVNSFRKDVETHLTENITFWRFFRRGVSGGQGSGQKIFPSKNYRKLPRNLWFSYVPKGEVPDSAEANYIENYLFLEFNSKTGTMRAGYTVTTASERVQNDAFRKILHERKGTVLEIIEEGSYQPYTASYSMGNKIESVEGLDEFLDEIGNTSYDDSGLGRRFLLTRTWTADELPIREESDRLFEPVEITRDVAEEMDEIHRLTYNQYPEIFYPMTQ